MAESVKVIDPNSGAGYDYASLYDWEAAEQDDIDASNTQAVAKCRCTGGTADTTPVTIGGWTTSATDYIKIWTDPSEAYRHAGVWVTGNKYRLEVGVNSGIAISEVHVHVYGLMISCSGEDRFGLAVAAVGAASTTWAGFNIIKGDTTYTRGFHNEYAEAGSYLYFWNNIIYNHYRGIHNTNTTAYIYNCTFTGCSNVGIYNSSTAYCKNVLSHNPASGDDRDFNSSGTMVCTNCASSGVTADDYGGSGNRVSQTFTFVSSSDFHLQSTDAGALGYGLNLYNDAAYPFQTDIDGQDRGGAAAAWDIGADEYVSSTAIEQEGFRFRNDDGSESAATWKASQDTNISLAADTAFRLRFLLKATGNPDSIDAQVEARVKPSGGAFGAWGKIN